MRVIYVFPGIIFGGAEIRTLELCKGLKSLGHKPMVACGHGPCIEMANRTGIQHHLLPVKSDKLSLLTGLCCIVSLISIILRNKIDIVVTLRRSMALIAHHATRVTSTRHVYMNLSIYSDKPWLRRKGDFTIAISNACLKNAVNYLKADPSRCTVVYRGVSIPTTLLNRNQSRKHLKILAQVPLIGTVCRLVPGKGLHFLLKAMVAVSKHLKDSILLIVGDGPEKKKLEVLRTELGLSVNSVIFLGMRRDVWDILPALDLFVYPSTVKEGLGSALIEAAMCGVPLIGSLCGGIPEIIEDGRNGILIPPSNTGALAEAIIQVLSKPYRAREMGKRARQMARKKFSKEREVLQTVHVLEAVLNGERLADRIKK